MKQTNFVKVLRIVCLVLAIGVSLVPALITMASGQGFSETTSHILISVSIVLLMAYLLLGVKKGNKQSLSSALAACVGLIYALIMQWV